MNFNKLTDLYFPRYYNGEYFIIKCAFCILIYEKYSPTNGHHQQYKYRKKYLNVWSNEFKNPFSFWELEIILFLLLIMERSPKKYFLSSTFSDFLISECVSRRNEWKNLHKTHLKICLNRII